MTTDDLCLELLGSPAAAGPARTLLGHRLRRWGHAALIDGGGWGLPLVQALSAECGVRDDGRGGKWVWATFRGHPAGAGR